MFLLLGLVLLTLCLSPTNNVECQTLPVPTLYTCTVDSCKEEAKASNFTGDVGCGYHETSGVKYGYRCIACNETDIAKKEKGFTEVEGCGLSTLIILVIVGVALLVTVVIILALCCLVPSCPLAKWRRNQGRKGGRGGGGGGRGRGGGATPSRNASKNTSRANLNSGGGNNRSRPPSNRASPSASRQSRRM